MTLTDKKGSIIVVSAPSGAGKTTIVKNILNVFPDIKFSVSATTRKKRVNETHGVEYFFLSQDEFLKKIEKNEFVEWEKVYDYYYGTLKSFIEDSINSGTSVLLELEVKGALNIKKLFPESVLIYIMPPSFEELKNRLINRKTETEEDLEKRLKRAEMELNLKDNFDYIVINNKLENAISEVKEIVKKYINKETI